MKRFLLSPLLLFLLALAPAEHSKVDVKMSFDKDDATIVFKVIPNEGHALTFDNAPWKLTIENPDGLMVDRKDLKWSAADLDTKDGSFTIKGKTKSSGKFKYRLNAFVCTKDKTRCYPQLHQKEVSWANRQLTL